MPRLPNGVLAVLAVAGQLALAACADPGPPTAPTSAAALARAAGGGADTRLVNMMDACDPTTFDAALNDPSACVRNGGVTFPQFIAQLTAHQQVGAWHFAPPMLEVPEGGTLVAVNRGGEVHTFTEVEDFGGGIVPLLNQLSGNPIAAPECLALQRADFIPPGGTQRETEDEAGVEHYQCCIHPWMRTTVRVRGAE